MSPLPEESSEVFSRSWRILLLVTLVFVLVQGWTAFRPGTTDDERHYFFSAHWMNSGGDWLTPRDQYGELRIHKPPLFTWLTALVYKLTGPRIASLRAVAILAGALSGWALYLLAGVLFRSRRAALLAGIMMLGFTEFNLNSGQGRPDSMLILFIIMANYCLARVVLGRPRPFAFTLLAYLAMGLAFMAKGPFGLLHTLPVPLITALIHRELRPNLKHLVNPLGWLLFLALTVPWYAAMVGLHGSEVWPLLMGDIAKNGPGSNLLLVVLENLRIFIRGGLVTSLPWWPLAAFFLAASRSSAFREELAQERPALTFVWIWLGLAMITILPNKSNYYRYLMVILPGLGLVAARLLSVPPNPAGWLWKRALPIYVAAQGLIYLAWAGYLGAAWFNFHDLLSDPFHFLLPAVLLFCGLVGFMAVQWRRKRIVWAVAALACLSIIANGTYARDLDPKSRRASLVKLAAEVLKSYDPETTVIYDLGLTEGEWAPGPGEQRALPQGPVPVDWRPGGLAGAEYQGAGGPGRGDPFSGKALQADKIPGGIPEGFRNG